MHIYIHDSHVVMYSIYILGMILYDTVCTCTSFCNYMYSNCVFYTVAMLTFCTTIPTVLFFYFTVCTHACMTPNRIANLSDNSSFTGTAAILPLSTSSLLKLNLHDRSTILLQLIFF